MRYRIPFFSVVFVLACFIVRAQEDIEITPPSNNKDSIRDMNIIRFPDHFFIYPVIKQRSLNFELEKTDGSDLLTFKPNNSFSFGVGFYLFEVGAEIAFAVPLNEQSKEIYGESEARDIQLNLLGKRWGMDIFYQKYSGFYVTDKGNEPAAGDPYPQRPDIDSRNLGVTGHYVFNRNRFSFRAIYNFSERQLYSKGSFLLFSTVNSFRFSADRSILTPEQEVIFGEDVSFKNLRYTTFSIAPGYTYSLIFKNFFLNGALSIGPAHHWIRHQRESGAGTDDIAINYFVAARIGIGYNGDRLFGGVGFYSQGSSVKFEGVQFSNNNGAFKILIGYRFREFGILKHRAWEAIPFKI
jgi:hypothetical protein